MSYWESRKNLNYYKQIKIWLEQLTGFDSIIDVGSADTPIATWGEFNHRIAVNKEYKPELENVDCIKNYWMQLDLKADVITCLQVLEHFETDYLKEFSKKILQSSKVAIISVPYNWQKGMCKYHKQDPINLQKLLDLIEQEPIKFEVVTDRNTKRLIALFKGEN